MTASIISDVNSLMMPTPQASESANSGSGFEDIFKSVNQNYSQNDSSQSRKNESAQNSSQNSDSNKVERNISDEKKNDVKLEKANTERSDKTEANSNGEQSNVTNESDTKVQQEPETKVKDASAQTDSAETRTEDVSTELTKEAADLVKLQAQNSAETKLQVELNSQSENQQPQTPAETTENKLPDEASQQANNLPAAPEVLPVQLQNAEDVLSLLLLNKQSQGEVSGLEKALSSQARTSVQGAGNSNYGLSQQAQNIQAPVLNPTLQPQTQLPTANAQVEPSPEANIPQLDANVVSDIQVQVSEDLASETASKVTIGDKQAIKEALNTSSLTQEMLDKTDAKVVSVSTSSSSSDSNNLLNRQNAQEQAVKLSLESTNGNLQGATDSMGQPVSFEKTLQSVQAPPPAQSHTSQELSKADILSQIHTKLNNFQDDTSNKVTIILKPESLGKIHLELVNSKEGLTAQMTTDNAQVKELLDKNLDGLKETLSNQGVNVNNVSVKVSETQKQDSMFAFDGQGEQNKQNPQSGKNNETGAFSSDEEAGDFLADQEFEGDSLTEASSVRVQHEGQVDYKI